MPVTATRIARFPPQCGNRQARCRGDKRKTVLAKSFLIRLRRPEAPASGERNAMAAPQRDRAGAIFVRGRALGVLSAVKRAVGRTPDQATLLKHRQAVRGEIIKKLRAAIRARKPLSDERWDRFAVLAKGLAAEHRETQSIRKRTVADIAR